MNRYYFGCAGSDPRHPRIFLTRHEPWTGPASVPPLFTGTHARRMMPMQ
jgi:hypothetical protein